METYNQLDYDKYAVYENSFQDKTMRTIEVSLLFDLAYRNNPFYIFYMDSDTILTIRKKIMDHCKQNIPVLLTDSGVELQDNKTAEFYNLRYLTTLYNDKYYKLVHLPLKQMQSLPPEPQEESVDVNSILEIITESTSYTNPYTPPRGWDSSKHGTYVGPAYTPLAHVHHAWKPGEIERLASMPRSAFKLQPIGFSSSKKGKKN